MLALFLILACAPTDPVEACVRVSEQGCACGRAAEFCSSETIIEDCEGHAEAGELDVDRLNCVYDELVGCEKENWSESDFYGFVQDADIRCSTAE